MPESISGYNKSIYHLLCGSFGQCVAIPKVINFNVLDIVAIGNVHVAIDIASA